MAGEKPDSRLFINVSPNVLFQVMNLLDTADVARLAHTNRQLRAAALDPLLSPWNNFHVKLSSDDDRWKAAFYKTLSRFANTIESLKLDVQLEFNFSQFPFLRRVKSLDISGNEEWLNLVQFRKLSRKLPSVTSLKFDYPGQGFEVFSQPRKAGHFCHTIDTAWAGQLVHLDLRLSRCTIDFGRSRVNAAILQDIISHLIAPMETLKLPSSFSTCINSAALTAVIQRSQDSLKSFGEYEGQGMSFEVTRELMAALSHCSKLTELCLNETRSFMFNREGREFIDFLGSLSTLRHLELALESRGLYMEWNALWRNPPFSLEHLSLNGTVFHHGTVHWTTLIRLQLPSLRFLAIPGHLKPYLLGAVMHPTATELPLKTLHLGTRDFPNAIYAGIGRFTQDDVDIMFARFPVLECVQVGRPRDSPSDWGSLAAELAQLSNTKYLVKDVRGECKFREMYSITKM